MLRRLSLISLSLLIPALLPAQAPWAAERSPLSVWAGAEVSSFNPDYGCARSSPFSCFTHQLVGVAPFVDANHLLFTRIGAEGEARFLTWRGPGGGLSEATYMAGPTCDLLGWKRIHLRGKFLIGGAHINVPKGAAGGGSYLAYAPGAEVNFRLAKRIAARVGYEYQFWPSFEGAASGGGGGLTPNGFSVGISYAILR